ncbi:hypothetical protein COCC4DRAFT_150281 [Bipolaris maydis ATCC 48331]|uniref:DUF7918 domain-containing protein n=2 Tax=Cochliobolus heterostrophus TaxID=5016 RepID=M2USR1_COCH5|nr:uncharacterized protein COCC4DRAFT_150281 [Bipolaris maydis ATCC 48331]EMD96636.1 hypothetical protein COCHEDRAFT_1085635 [Bipolaris maydis C5]KAJ6211283.1 hypothetical protein PSV09DRAFT_1085635 [Bipolaris maydis]ENI00540.1 hypothetical protein COCC4DRAFT_150281 [Bipolaris maydis ATCC 48331]KAJ6273665.1 hypothetical protein PSV08DRAFT_369068 [Bipolaris maydis]KAJ6284882.1 hypothetical protein J3E71DRAFT_169918 [Bipolaris maydis]
MAPSIAYPGLYAEVTVDGCRLTEYDDGEDAHSKTKTVYIQSEAGEQFGVQYFIPPSLFMEYGIKAEVSIDGVSMRKYIHDSYVGRLHGVSRHACASSAHIGNLFIGQRFRFATLDTHDETETVNTAVQNQLAVTGDISVSFYRITNIRVASAGKKAPTIHEYDKVPEKALKGSAVSLKTQLDPFERIAPVTWVEADHVDGDRPFAVIQFKYRSAAALRSLHILPPLQNSMSLERGSVSQPSMAKKALPLGVYHPGKEVMPATKRQRTENDEDPDVKLVGERSAKRRCLPTDKDEIIVLE